MKKIIKYALRGIWIALIGWSFYEMVGNTLTSIVTGGHWGRLEALGFLGAFIFLVVTYVITRE